MFLCLVSVDTVIEGSGVLGGSREVGSWGRVGVIGWGHVVIGSQGCGVVVHAAL